MLAAKSASILSLIVAGCITPGNVCQAQQQSQTLVQARHGFVTHLVPKPRSISDPDDPPASVFKLIKYPAKGGYYSAYLSPDLNDGKKRPAIVWIAGGDCNSIGDAWTPQSRNNDQSAAQYRKAGIVMMFPSLRGGNRNAGVKEGFLGEVDDVVAAAQYLAALKYVDPNRIYLGGHSTGGTLALLVAEYATGLRAVFSFGPVDDVSSYGADSGFIPFNISNRKEVVLRSPAYWLSCISSPTWVIEGASQGNIDSLREMRSLSRNPKVQFVEIRNATHFSSLAPTNELIAKKIVADTGPRCNIKLSEVEANQNFGR